MKRIYLIVALMLSSLPVLAADRVLSGPAIVKENGTIAIDGYRVRLFGIQLAPLGRDCRTFARPIRCAEKAVLVLSELITGFVHCRLVRGVQAICSVAGRRLFDERIDLASQLLMEGFAITTPDSPAIYRKLEDIAKSRKAGVWGRSFIDIR